MQFLELKMAQFVHINTNPTITFILIRERNNELTNLSLKIHMIRSSSVSILDNFSERGLQAETPVNPNAVG